MRGVHKRRVREACKEACMQGVHERRAREACIKGLCERRVKKRVSDIRLECCKRRGEIRKEKKNNNNIQHAVNKMLK